MKKEKIWIMILIICLILTCMLRYAAENIRGFAVWYADSIYPAIVGSVGRVTGLFGISVVEILLYAALICTVVYTLCHINNILPAIIRIFTVLSAILLIFMLNCGINYYNTPFSSYMGISVKGASKEGLEALCEYLASSVNKASENIDNTYGVRYTKDWNAEGVKAMEKLGMSYPKLGGFYPPPKPLLFPEILSVQQILGVYSPFTVEANYNGAVIPYNIPHTICHELSHLKGFMREDEANFIGYLACIDSDNADFIYSGYLIGFIYASNELAKTDMERYRKIYDSLSYRVREDLKQNSEYWSRYEGRAAETSNRINDAYLKANSQSDGIKSYGRMVDLLLSYYNYK